MDAVKNIIKINVSHADTISRKTLRRYVFLSAYGVGGGRFKGTGSV